MSKPILSLVMALGMSVLGPLPAYPDPYLYLSFRASPKVEASWRLLEQDQLRLERRQLATQALTRLAVRGHGYQGTVIFRAGDLADGLHELEVSDWRVRDLGAALGAWWAQGWKLLLLLLLAGWGLTRVVLQRWLHRRRRRALVDNSSPDPWLGRQIGPYLLVRPLGRGGMATVYAAVAAEHPDPERPVAVKVMAESGRLEAEARALFHLRHPNLVALLDWGTDRGTEYLVTELVEGGTLRQQILPQGMPLDSALNWFLPLLQGVSWAHDQGIVHRDIKPENVLLTPSGQVKLADFGLARPTTGPATSATAGTLDYLAPELVQGARATPASDQYSLGLVLYELLSGQLPPGPPDPMGRLLARTQDPPELPENWPDPLQKVLHRCLDPDPVRRFATLCEFQSALLAATTHGQE